jgi:hypothetical protein
VTALGDGWLARNLEKVRAACSGLGGAVVLLNVGSQAEEWVHGWGPLRAAGNSRRDQCATGVPLMAGPGRVRNASGNPMPNHNARMLQSLDRPDGENSRSPSQRWNALMLTNNPKSWL